MHPTLGIKASDRVATAIRSAMEEGIPQDTYCSREFQELHDTYVSDNAADMADQLYVLAAEVYLEAHSGGLTKYELEQEHAEFIHKRLRAFPTEALQDPGFWRYLALFPFRRFLTVREDDLKPIRYGGGSGSSKSKWLLPRTFIWGRKCYEAGSDSYDLVHKMRDLRVENGYSKGTVIDFYHSHVVRPAWSSDTSVAQEFLTSVFTGDLLFDKDNSANRPTNRMGSAIARLSNNVLLEVSNSAVAREIHKVKAHIKAEELDVSQASEDS
jgi:hypothetical protein